MKYLYVDMDGVLSECGERLARTAVNGQLGPDAFSYANMMADMPIPDAIKAMRAFANEGWYIVVLTARGLLKDGERMTTLWLEGHRMPCHAVRLVGRAEDKPVVLAASRSDLFIDDFMGAYETGRPRFVSKVYEACLATGVRVECFRNNWPEIVYRILGVNL